MDIGMAAPQSSGKNDISDNIVVFIFIKDKGKFFQ